MAEVRISERARSNLESIYDYSREQFGAYQAEAYLSGLERTFGLLADFPLIGQDAGFLRKGYRRFRFQSHYVFYSQMDGGVVIRAVLHTARSIRPPTLD